MVGRGLRRGVAAHHGEAFALGREVLRNATAQFLDDHGGLMVTREALRGEPGVRSIYIPIESGKRRASHVSLPLLSHPFIYAISSHVPCSLLAPSAAFPSPPLSELLT